MQNGKKLGNEVRSIWELNYLLNFSVYLKQFKIKSQSFGSIFIFCVPNPSDSNRELSTNETQSYL